MFIFEFPGHFFKKIRNQITQRFSKSTEENVFYTLYNVYFEIIFHIFRDMFDICTLF